MLTVKSRVANIYASKVPIIIVIKKLAGTFLINENMAINNVNKLTITIGEVKSPNSINVLFPFTTRPLCSKPISIKKHPKPTVIAF